MGLRDLALAELTIERSIAPAIEAFPQDDALALLPVLTDGRTHAVVIVDAGRKVLGLVTQTDLLAAVAGIPANAQAPAKAVPPKMALNA